MAEPTTAFEWQQVANNYQNQISEIQQQLSNLRAQRAELIEKRNLVAQVRSQFPQNSVGWKEAQSQFLIITNQIAGIDRLIEEYVAQEQAAINNYNYAIEQSRLAEQGPPNTNINTPPASDTGNPTDPVAPNIPALAAAGSVAIGEAINPETGETYFTPVNQISGLPILEEPSIEDTEFGDLAGAIADQEGTGLREPPVLSDSEVEAYLNNIATQDPLSIDNISLPSPSGLTNSKTRTRAQATRQDEANFKQKEDWRVRLSLAPESYYLYNVPGNQGILAPLAATNGIIFPYTPSINISYLANYDNADITHTNYKIYQYKGSAVDSIVLGCDFTAQDTFEANYLLAVIHFLRTVTKMFYGQDQTVKPGTPPPLCYLSGLGAFQFDSHPLAITQFNYVLPTDVDYIRAGTTTTTAGVNRSSEQSVINTNVIGNSRNTNLGPGGTVPPPKFTNVPGGTIEPTYVPTKMNIQISAIPIVSRNDISNRFSVTDYATGKLLRGSQNKRAGIW